MSLAIGHKLTHYEILEPIGKGGMGEVYRARDTKLGRDVAIKVLHEEFLQDKERLDRFEREARILAQLNHANIATLHGLEESDGQQFLVMELVEGETLAERIAKGPMPVDEAVPLMKVPVGGGPAMHLYPQSEPLGASWGDDGFIYFAETDSGERNGIYRIPEAGGTPERVTVPDQASGEVAHWWPEVLPGGSAILFRAQSGAGRSGISAVSLQNGERREVIAPGNRPLYAPTGHLLYHSGLVGYAIPFDPVRLETSGASVPLTEIAGSIDVSATGTLAYTTRSTAILRSGELVWVNRDGQQQLVTEGRRGYQPHPRIAPDGRRIAVTSAPEGEIPVDIWTLDVDRDVFSRITISMGTNAAIRPVWSGDGSRIFFASNRNGQWEIFSKSSDGTGEETQVTFGARRFPASISADGSLLFYRESGVDSGLNIGVLRLDVESVPELIFDSKFNETTATLSARWEVARLCVRRIGSARGLRRVVSRAGAETASLERRRRGASMGAARRRALLSAQ